MLGLGIDVVDIARVEALLGRHGERFRARLFTPAELSVPRARAEAAESARLAMRWAAKEAFLKALGPHAAGVPMRAVAVEEGGDMPERLRPCGAAATALAATGASVALLAVARGGGHAAALVVLV